jgi:predicted nucleic acid-binding protein
MGGTLYLLDTNILLRCVQPRDPDFALVTVALERLTDYGSVLCYTSQNVAEFWNTCTRPVDRNGYGLSPDETDLRARAFESRLRLLPDGIAVHQEWRRLVVAHRVSGVQVYDARLVASMVVHGVERMLTFNNRDFARFQDIKAIHPRDGSALHP